MPNSEPTLILMDIEGTTTDIAFVKNVLFPFSRQKLESFLRNERYTNMMAPYLQMVRDTLKEEEKIADADAALVLKTLYKWIDEDRKHPGLKGLQGLIWKEGYVRGEYEGHVYPDVPRKWAAWKNEMGKVLAIYSSGSVEAQKLLFRYSDQGDLTPYLSYYFDTKMGAKTAPSSYKNILQELQRLAVIDKASEVLFLSDVAAELDAAKKCGMNTAQLIRPPATLSSDSAASPHLQVSDFDELSGPFNI